VNRPNFFASFGENALVNGSPPVPRGCSGAGKAAVGSNPRTSPAIFAVHKVASKRVIGPIPERPAFNPSQVAAALFPKGVTAPRPVTTTRRRTGAG
jgi:hypothetical protein